MDKINLKGLKIFANHGVLAQEKENGQEFVIDLTIFTKTREAGLLDDLNKTINYAELSLYVNEVFKEKTFDLIEAASEYLAQKILVKFYPVKGIELVVHKPQAPIEVPFEDVSVTIKREWHRAYIAVGSNLGDSRAIIRNGIDELAAYEDIVLLKESSLIDTKPYGVEDQPDFVNGMIEIDTLLDPYELLYRIHEVEASNKRERLTHWGPRTLDLDIIYYDELVMRSKDLTIPHADMQYRSFVLKPLREINPYKEHPVTKLTADEMIKRL